MRTPINILLCGLSVAQWLLAANYLAFLVVEHYRMQWSEFFSSFFIPKEITGKEQMDLNVQGQRGRQNESLPLVLAQHACWLSFFFYVSSSFIFTYSLLALSPPAHSFCLLFTNLWNLFLVLFIRY
uniref:GPI mannosyltransferase 2 n=1 Tax=Heterorhabditis bacteriophora TaxID=37862 RepID=A0A1I7WB96_HETBA